MHLHIHVIGGGEQHTKPTKSCHAPGHNSDMSDSYSNDETASEDETASSPISLSKSLSVTPPPYSPCTMSSSHSDGEKVIQLKVLMKVPWGVKTYSGVDTGQ